jgi:hypothetical protein
MMSCEPAQVGQRPLEIVLETDIVLLSMGYPLSRGALLGIGERPKIVCSVDLHELRLNLPVLAGGRYDVDVVGQGRSISLRRRAEAIDSELRDRDATGALTGRRVREGVFGEQPQGSTLGVSIGWPLSGLAGQRPGPARQQASPDLQKAGICWTCDHWHSQPVIQPVVRSLRISAIGLVRLYRA